MLLDGNIKAYVGLHVAHGPEVARVCSGTVIRKTYTALGSFQFGPQSPKFCAIALRLMETLKMCKNLSNMAVKIVTLMTNIFRKNNLRVAVAAQCNDPNLKLKWK